MISKKFVYTHFSLFEKSTGIRPCLPKPGDVRNSLPNINVEFYTVYFFNLGMSSTLIFYVLTVAAVCLFGGGGMALFELGV